MIRLIVEQKFTGDKKYIEAAGNSIEEKPTEDIITGSLYFEVDTGKFYAFDEMSATWNAINPNATPITGATVTLGSSLTYNGSEQTQAVSSVVLGTETLTADTDYYVVQNKATDAGDYTLYVVGKGSYCGIVAKTFTVAKANGSLSASPNSLSLEPNGENGESALTVTGDGALSVASSDNDVCSAVIVESKVIVIPLAEGTATLTVTLSAGANYNGTTATISVTVAEGDDT